MKVKAVLHELCCANCAAKIEEQVSRLEGVENVTVNFLTEKMILMVRDDKVDAVKTQIKKIVGRIEPDVTVEFQ